ncbi:MAG: hypothetical protein JWL79_2708 [Frankiales bacterium]|nr:hypothetical protein [Frankiales bacterium]
MCWMCDNPEATFEDYLDDVVRPVVARLGHAIQATDRHGAPVAYTVGLAARGQPELVVTGKPPDDAHDLIEAVVAGEEVPTAGRRCDLLRGPALWAFAVTRPETLHVAVALTPGLTALQLVWADSLGRWPWEVHRSSQRLLFDLGRAWAA